MEGVIADLGKLREQIRHMKTMQSLLLDLATVKSEVGDLLATPKVRTIAESYLADSQLIKSADYLTSLEHEESLIAASHDKLSSSKEQSQRVLHIFQKLTGLEVKVESQEVDRDLDVKITNYTVKQSDLKEKVELEGKGELSDLEHNITWGMKTYNLNHPSEARQWRNKLVLGDVSAKRKFN